MLPPEHLRILILVTFGAEELLVSFSVLLVVLLQIGCF